MSNFLIALIMISVSWRTSSATCSRRRPSFIALRRKFSGQKAVTGATSQPAAFADAAAAGRPYSLCQSIYVPAHPRDNGSMRALVTISLRTSNSLTPATHNNSTSSSTSISRSEKHTEPFTWSQLIGLFRSSTSPRSQDVNYIPSDHPNLALFRRSAAAQASYKQHNKYLDKYWRSAYDYLVVSKFGEGFGFEKIEVNVDGSEVNNISSLIDDDCVQSSMQDDIPPKGRMYQARPSLTQASQYTIDNGISYLSLVPNDFPYDVAEGIEHWCLWKIGGCSNTEGILRNELSWALHELKDLQPAEKSGSGCILERKEQTNSRVTSGYSQMPPNDLVLRPGLIEDTLYWVNPPHLQSMPKIHHAHILVLRSNRKGIRSKL